MEYQLLVENKKFFINLLNSILVNRIYDGIMLLNSKSQEVYLKIKDTSKITQIGLFKLYLDEIKKINIHSMDVEYMSIKRSYQSPELFDDIIKCTVKSFALCIIYPDVDIISNSTYQNINVSNFIHKCYVECSEYFYNNPELLNKIYKKEKTFEIIELCIENTIKNCLPLSITVKNYLDKKMVIKPVITTKDIEKIVNEMMHNNLKGGTHKNDKKVSVLLDDLSIDKKNNSDVELKEENKENNKEDIIKEETKSKEKSKEHKSSEEHKTSDENESINSESQTSETSSYDDNSESIDIDDDENFDREYHSAPLNDSELEKDDDTKNNIEGGNKIKVSKNENNEDIDNFFANLIKSV